MTMDELESGQWTHARPLRSRLGRVENVRILDFNGRCPRRMGHFSIRLVSLHLDGKMVHLIVYEFFVPLDARRNSLTATVLHGIINQLLREIGPGNQCFIYYPSRPRIL